MSMTKFDKDAGKFFVKDGNGMEYRILNQRYNGAVQQIKEFEVQSTRDGQTRWIQEKIIKMICKVSEIPMIANGLIVKRHD